MINCSSAGRGAPGRPSGRFCMSEAIPAITASCCTVSLWVMLHPSQPEIWPQCGQIHRDESLSLVVKYHPAISDLTDLSVSGSVALLLLLLGIPELLGLVIRRLAGSQRGGTFRQTCPTEHPKVISRFSSDYTCSASNVAVKKNTRWQGVLSLCVSFLYLWVTHPCSSLSPSIPAHMLPSTAAWLVDPTFSVTFSSLVWPSACATAPCAWLLPALLYWVCERKLCGFNI